MRSVVGTGKTIEEAVQDALARLGARPDEVELRKLEEPSGGLMGNAPRPARVRVTWREGLGPAVAEPETPAERQVLGAPRAFSGEESYAPGGRPSRGDRGDRGDRGPRRERGERGGRGGRFDREGRGERGDRPDRGDRESRPRRPHTPLSPEERFQVDDAFLARVREETSWLLSRMGFDATVDVAQRSETAFSQFVMMTPFPGTVDFQRWEKDQEKDPTTVNGVPLTRYWLIPRENRPRLYMPHPSMTTEQIRQGTQHAWNRFYSLRLIWQRACQCTITLRSRLAFTLISKLYLQMYGRTGIATDSARISRAAGWARWLAKKCLPLFRTAPMPELKMPARAAVLPIVN